MSIGQSMMNWLRTVDKDQNLQGIGDLTSTSMSDRVRRWFRRQDLTPTLDTGYYDTVNEKYALGPALQDHIPYQRTYANLNTSAQNHDFVITAGQTWEILACGTVNVSAASTVGFRWTLDNMTTEHVVPGVQQPGSSAQANSQGGVTTTLVITGSTTDVYVRCFAATFAGGNVRESTIAYRRLA